MSELTHAAAVGHAVRLGKLEVKHDTRTLQLERYVDAEALLPSVPASAAWSPKVKRWPMYANDRLGDCTCAAVGHMEEGWSANAGQPEVPKEQAVLDLYWATGTADTGRYCLDVLNYWHTRGFDGERCTAFVQIDPRRLRHVELACWMFGGVYIGLLLPRSAQWQRDEWTLSSGADARPGSWGGHAVNLIDYTRGAGPVCVTWGRLLPMTWQFFEAYCDEAYAVLSPDWATQRQKAPSGFDVAQLERDLAAIKGTPMLLPVEGVDLH